jgi:hypothetical protein
MRREAREFIDIYFKRPPTRSQLVRLICGGILASLVTLIVVYLCTVKF